MLKLKDLKQQGLHLSQLEAQEIHSAINGVSQGHNPAGIIFEKSVSQPIAEKPDLLKNYYAELQLNNTKLITENNELRKENIDLSLQLKEVKGINSTLSNDNEALHKKLKISEATDNEQSEKIKGKPGRKPNK